MENIRLLYIDQSPDVFTVDIFVRNNNTQLLVIQIAQLELTNHNLQDVHTNRRWY